MRNIRKILALAIVLFFPFSGVVPAAAQSQGIHSKKEGSSKKRRLNLRRIQKQLQLTNGQLDQIRRHRAVFRKKRAQRSGKIKVLTVEYESEMEKQEPDRKKVDRITKEINDLRAEEVRERVDSKLEERKILTPEQLDKLKTLQSEDGSDPDGKSDPK